MFMIFIRQVPRNMMVVHKLFNTICSLANKEFFFLLFPAKILFSVFCFAAWVRSSPTIYFRTHERVHEPVPSS